MNVSRSGYSLLEMVMIIPVITLLLSINAVWIQRTLSFSRKAREHRNHQMSLDRLTDRFRIDSRLATVAETVAGGSQLTLGFRDGSTVEYSFAAPTVVRKKTDGGQTLSFDRFELAKETVVVFDGDGLPEWISISISRTVDSGHGAGTQQPEAVEENSAGLMALTGITVRVGRWTADSTQQQSETGGD